jgi:hypothetical protein
MPSSCSLHARFFSIQKMVTPDDETNKPSEKRKTTADALGTRHAGCWQIPAGGISAFSRR